MNKVIIVAPHLDDEVIGCYQILKTGDVYAVLYGNKNISDMESTKISTKHFDFLAGDVKRDLGKYSKMGLKFYFPDPYFEFHPDHRRWGAVGEKLLREGENVIFYSTNMNAPYIHEVADPLEKRDCLDTLYPDKKSLWKYDHKYFLFEGYTKWIIPKNV